MSEEKMRQALKARLREIGISAREASRRLGRNLGYVGDIIEGRSKNPDAEEVLRLAELLDMDSADLLGESRAVSAPTPWRESVRRGGERMLPLYAAPLPINRQFVPFGDEPVGRVPCPGILLEMADAFAAKVPNNASAPRFFAGETVFVSPAATPGTGDFVWVRLTNGLAGIGRLADMGAESFQMEFLGLEGDERTADVPFNGVRAIEKIVATAL